MRWLIILPSLCLSAQSVLCFIPSIHEDITQASAVTISRVVEGRTLKFTQTAINELRKSNTATDQSAGLYKRNAYWHFTDELFLEASNRLIIKKNEAVAALKQKSRDPIYARNALGTALHTLQDFYAHSSWTDIKGTLVNTDLGRKILPNPLKSTRFCELLNPSKLLPGVTSITSGYFSYTCKVNPPGILPTINPLSLPSSYKCVHAPHFLCPLDGLLYPGMSKDDSSSPGFWYAKTAAIKATSDYLNQVLDQLSGDSNAIKALMGYPYTLAIATGRMGEEISSVKKQVASIVEGTSRSGDVASLGFLLVPFSDPDVGPIFKTTDPSEFISTVNALSPNGEGDCAEMACGALLAAIENSSEGSRIFLFTEALAKDRHLLALVVFQAMAKNIAIMPVFTGTCSPVDPAYIQMAEETGGQVLFIDKSQVSQLFDFILPQLSGDLVNVAQWRGDHSEGDVILSFPVDSSMSTLIIIISFSTSSGTGGTYTVKKPDGTIVNGSDERESITTLGANVIVNVENPGVGEWSVSLVGSDPFTVTVQGKSAVDLGSLAFVEVIDGFYGPAYKQVSGSPVRGDDLTALARFLGNVTSISYTLVDENGAEIPSTAIAVDNDDPLAAEDNAVLKFAEPNKPFRVIASGLDGEGQPFRRLFLQKVSLQSVKVSIDPSSVVGNIKALETTILSFIVKNMGNATAVLNVEATDDHAYITGKSPVALSIAPGESESFEVSIMPTKCISDNDFSVTVAVDGTADGTPVKNSETVTLDVAPCNNRRPDCGKNVTKTLSPPSGNMVQIDILTEAEVTDPDDDPLTVNITSILQNEPVFGSWNGSQNGRRGSHLLRGLKSGKGSGPEETSPDGTGVGTGVAEVRAEHYPSGDGRIYVVNFEVSDALGETCDGSMIIKVPYDLNDTNKTNNLEDVIVDSTAIQGKKESDQKKGSLAAGGHG